MNKKKQGGIAALLGICVFIYAPTVAPPLPKEERVIAFYNLENCYDTIDDPLTTDEEFTPLGNRHYTAEIMRHKLSNLSRVISELGPTGREYPPDLLGVAEVENRAVLQELVRRPLLARARYRIIHHESPDPRGIDVALLYQSTSFQPLEHRPLSVLLPGGTKQVRFTRDILYVKGLLDEDTFHILVNHWPSRRGGEVRSAPARMAAAKICRHFIDSLESVHPHSAIIVMGDLNDDPDSRSIVRWLGASGKGEDDGNNILFNPWVAFYQKGIGTLANKDRWGLFDQILFSRSLLFSGKKNWFWGRADICRKPYLSENQGQFKGYPMRTWDGNRYRGGFSDHFPTYITLIKKAG